jgi:hypothetical protein
MDNIHQYQVLKQLGLKDKNEWLLYDNDKGNKFFHYLENVGNINVLNSEEYEYSREREYLKDEKLAKELETLESHFPGLFLATQQSNDDMEQDILFWNLDTAQSNFRTSRIEESEKEQLKILEKADRNKMNLNFRMQQNVSSSILQSESLQELQNVNQTNIKLSKELYLQLVIYSI